MTETPAHNHGKGRVLIVMETSDGNRYMEAAMLLVVKHGFCPQVVTLRSRGMMHEIMDKIGVPAIALDCHTSRDYPRAVFRLAKLIRRLQCDLVHASEAIPAALCGLAVRFGPAVPCIFHRHHCESTGERAFFTAIASRYTQLTMAVSRATANTAIAENGLDDKAVKVAYNGISPLRSVDREELKALRRSLSIPDDSPVITLVARLRPVKGHSTLFQALPLLRERLGKTPHVLIVGSGPDEAKLRSEATAIRDAVIHWVGHTDDVALWYHAAEVAAMPSYSESFGLVAVEAMACRVPLVASAVEGLAEVVEDSSSGLLVPPRDPRALAEALARAVSDQALRERLIAGGWQRYSRFFTLDAMVSAWVDCYRLVLPHGEMRFNTNPPQR